MIAAKKNAGFTLIELMIVVAVIAVIAVIAIPKFASSKLSANELSAIATLKAIAQAQNQVQASNSIDTDADGAAEFAYVGELSGLIPTRVAVGGLPGPGTPGQDEITPPAMSEVLANVSNSVITKSGYMFQVFLPAPAVGGLVPALPEDPNGGKAVAPFPGSNEGEVLWCAYAWPMVAKKTGTPVFFVNQEGVILKSPNRGAVPYQGLAGAPPFDAAFTIPGDMSSSVAGIVGGIANDGNLWVSVN
jgi:type IV pilus assembly protein PilA